MDMAFRFWNTFRRLRTHHYIYGREITPETRADPLVLSEDEFPVHCPKCRYLLRQKKNIIVNHLVDIGYANLTKMKRDLSW